MKWIQKILKARRQKKISADLIDALDLISNGLKACLSLPQAIQLVALEFESPLGEEFERVVHQLKMGQSLEEALLQMEDRIGLEEITFVVQSILVLKQVGGNLVKHFDALGSLLRERQNIAGKIQVLTAQGVFQSILIGLMPLSLGLGLALIAPDFVSPLWGTSFGNCLLCLAVFLEGFGFLCLRKILIIRV